MYLDISNGCTLQNRKIQIIPDFYRKNDTVENFGTNSRSGHTIVNSYYIGL